MAADQRGLGVVVLHPGSYEVRVGMAWDRQPKVKASVVFSLAMFRGSLPSMQWPIRSLLLSHVTSYPHTTCKVVKHVVAKRIMKFNTAKGGGKRSAMMTPQAQLSDHSHYTASSTLRSQRHALPHQIATTNHCSYCYSTY